MMTAMMVAVVCDGANLKYNFPLSILNNNNNNNHDNCASWRESSEEQTGWHAVTLFFFFDQQNIDSTYNRLASWVDRNDDGEKI